MIRWITKDLNFRNNKLTKSAFTSNIFSNDNTLMNNGRISSEALDERGFLDPFLMKNMGRAVKRIDSAIKAGEAITLYGNYSVEGIVGTSMLVRAFRKLGVELNYYIDDCEEHISGINAGSIDYIKTLATDLIIMVDTGANSADEIYYAALRGMDTIVLDAQDCSETVPDTVLLSPGRNGCAYPFKDLSGCGVVFKLIEALWKYYGLSGCEEILDIAVIGISSGVCRPEGENKSIIEEGLKRFRCSEKCGIQAIKRSWFKVEADTLQNITDEIVPIIDAAKRELDPRIIVELFTTNDYDKALQIMKYLLMESRGRFYIGEEQNAFV